MATRPSSKATDIVQDAQQLIPIARKRLPAIVKADKEAGKKKGTNMSTLQELIDSLAAYKSAKASQGAKTSSARSATQKEEIARANLAAALVEIRDDVADAYPEDEALQRAFGRGAALSARMTNPLLDASDDFISAFDTHAGDVAGAGVSKARIAKVAKLRDTLAAADTAQRSDLGERSDATLTKDQVLANIKKLAARIRDRIARADRAAKAATKRKGTLKSSSPRKTVKKRAPKVAQTDAKKPTKS